MSYTEINSKMIDRWVNEGWEWSKEISHEDFILAKKNKKGIFLTPIKDVPESWLKDIKGKKVLGLASAGGQQMPVLVARGAIATVMDFSEQMLEKERIVAERESYDIEIIRGDMSKRFPFEDDSFDMIVNPVSNIYVEDVNAIFKECYRVLKKGGLLMAGLDNGLNFIFDDDEKVAEHKLPFNPNKDKAIEEYCIKEDIGFQFSHSIEEQIGGQLRAGFKLLDIFEDSNNAGYMSSFNMPFYYATLSKKE